VTRDSVKSNRDWIRRLDLPYLLLSDAEGEAGRAFGVVRRIGLGSWNVELYRRATFLIDREGAVAGIWSRVKIRGHATEVLDAALALERKEESR
jgi:peroxiredoxin Q/BCP